MNLVRLKKQAEDVRGCPGRPTKVWSNVFVRLVDESGTQNAGFLKAAEEYRKAAPELVYIKAEHFVAMVDAMPDPTPTEPDPEPEAGSTELIPDGLEPDRPE